MTKLAVDDFVLDPEFMVKMGHAALRQGVENIQHNTNKLGSGGPIVGRQSAFLLVLLLLLLLLLLWLLVAPCSLDGFGFAEAVSNGPSCTLPDRVGGGAR